MKIFYCDKCGLRVSPDAISSGEATLKDDVATCSDCLPARAPVHSKKPGGTSRIKLTAVDTNLPSSSPVRVKTTAMKAPKQNSIPVLVLVIVPLVIIAWVFVLNRPPSYTQPEVATRPTLDPIKPSTAPVAKEPVKPAVKEEPAPRVNPPAIANADAEIQKIRFEQASKMLAEAKAFAAANPSDFVACKDKYLQIVMAYRDSPAATEAIRLLAELKQPAPAAPPATVATVTPPVPAPATPAAPVEPVASVAKPVEVPATAPVKLSFDGKVAYQAVAAEIYSLAASDQGSAAKQKIAQAKADPLLQTALPQLNLDLQLMDLIQKTKSDAMKGVEALLDKREFTFVKADGKQVRVGGNSGSSVLGVKDGAIQLEIGMGGAKAQMKLDLAQMSFLTHYELAKLALPKSPESELELGFAALMLQLAGAKGMTPTIVQEHLKKAQASDAQKEAALHLEARMAAQRSESAAEALMKNLDAAVRNKKWTDVKQLIEWMKAEHADSIVYNQRKAWIEERQEQATLQLSPLQPKLWSSYWKHLNGEAFKEFVLAKPDAVLNTEGTMLPPNDKMEYINFGIRFHGVLRVEIEGKYKLKGRADDYMTVWIDGKQALKAIVSISETESEVSLTKGDHKIKIDVQQDGGSWSYGLLWQPPGATGFVAIPENALWHDPKLIEQYKKE